MHVISGMRRTGCCNQYRDTENPEQTNRKIHILTMPVIKNHLNIWTQIWDVCLILRWLPMAFEHEWIPAQVVGVAQPSQRHQRPSALQGPRYRGNRLVDT